MFKELVNIWTKENLIEQALKESQGMLAMDYEMFLETTTSLRQRNNSELSFDIYKRDKEINEYEREVRKKVLTHLSVTGPQNIATGLVLVSIVIDIERIGDYTKNIADIALNHPKQLKVEEMEGDLCEFEAAVKESFAKTQEAFKNSDKVLAREMMLSYKDFSRRSDKRIGELVREEVADLSSGSAVAAALYMRYLKRINAHLKNIASSIVNPFDRIGYDE
jgi:phosphate transport system protein